MLWNPLLKYTVREYEEKWKANTFTVDEKYCENEWWGPLDLVWLDSLNGMTLRPVHEHFSPGNVQKHWWVHSNDDNAPKLISNTTSSTFWTSWNTIINTKPAICSGWHWGWADTFAGRNICDTKRAETLVCARQDCNAENFQSLISYKITSKMLGSSVVKGITGYVHTWLLSRENITWT